MSGTVVSPAHSKQSSAFTHTHCDCFDYSLSEKNRNSAAYNEQCNSHKKLKTTHSRYPAVALSLPLYEDFCILRTNLREWNQEMGHYKNNLAHITHTKANNSSLYEDVEI